MTEFGFATTRKNKWNIRSLFEGTDRPYYEFNREERHLAAILFHVLANPENVRCLLKAHCPPSWKISEPQFGIYFEYSFLRDLWATIGSGAKFNEKKKDAILHLLLVGGGFTDKMLEELKVSTAEKFNSFFLERGKKIIQSPANWQLRTLARKVEDDAALVSACKIKWAFKAKPDLVIQTDQNHALCIELKFKSRVSQYPADSAEIQILKEERKVFGTNKPFPIKQTCIQKFLMNELLGLETRFLLVTQKGGEGSISWFDLLKPLNVSVPPHMLQTLRLVTNRSCYAVADPRTEASE